MIDPTRVRIRKSGDVKVGPVVYWMQRDMRAHHNWALLYAQEEARTRKVPLLVLFNQVSRFGYAQQKFFRFLLQGLSEVGEELEKVAIPLCFTEGEPQESVTAFLAQHNASLLVTDQNPLRLPEAWKNGVAQLLTIPWHEVDAHNIVPVWEASDHEEYMAATLRPKMRAKYAIYRGSIPKTKKHPYPYTKRVPLFKLASHQKENVYPWISPGAKAGEKALKSFIATRLHGYDENRNDPTKEAQSDLSPYLHFGMISAQQVAHEVEKSEMPQKDIAAFLEELIVRRELSDNFCFYQKKYDSFEGLRSWAQESLTQHLSDSREYLYTKKQFEEGETHDQLWNAAQREMVVRGKMHGYMRMYWAKKILEWTKTPQEAIDIAIYLNDTYSLDGRDPNGYVGILWSIGGIHDRAWFERPVFGKVRYMNYNGCRRKFDVDAYIAYTEALV